MSMAQLLADPAKLAAAASSVPTPDEFFSYIDGKAVRGELDPIPVDNPVDGQAFAQAPSCSKAQLDTAVAAARGALTGWGRLGEAKRKQLMMEVAAKLVEPQNMLLMGKVLCMEQGKKLADGVKEVLGCFAWIKGTNTFSIPEPEVLQEDKKMRVEQHMRPVGVVAAICPWNFPVLLAMWKIAPAMVAGCTMVLKPSPYTPLATTLLAKVINEVLPPGVFNLVSGGNDLGAWMTDHDGFDKISFTGSVPTGKAIQAAAAGTLKRLTLELGGNDPAIILPGTDVKAIAKAVFDGVCCAIKRVFVHEDDHDALVEALVREAGKAKVGDGLDPTTTHGPLNNKMQLEIVRRLVEEARARGARVLCGGEQVGSPGGFAFAPTIIAGGALDDSFGIVREEQFGPALPVLKYKNVDEALARANDSEVGLGGSVWGNDTAAAAAVAAQLQSGSAWVNQHKQMTPFTPFGGFKQSGIGREGGLGGLMNFLEPQTFNVAKGKPWAKL
eukprot:g2837.t1